MLPTQAKQTRLGDLCLAPGRVEAPLDGSGRYGRMFELAPLKVDEGQLHRTGAAGGFCDGGATESDARVEAGWPFFGQYIAHDLTADRSPPQAHADLQALQNMRTPRADLESLYGAGPVGAPYLYQREDPAKLLENAGDVPRNHEGLALIGDPRNDTHVFMSQLHLAFIHAHNWLVDQMRGEGVSEVDLFEQARRSLCWHYQWLIVNDFLPVLVGDEMVDELLRDGPRFYRPDGAPFIPLEFADAAYRYGHSQIRESYRLQRGGEPASIFPDLIGFNAVGGRHVDWSLLFDVPGLEPAQRAKPIDGKLTRSLIELPVAITGTLDNDAYRSLATRDLERGRGTGLPSGESVARFIGADVLTEEEIGLRAQGWRSETPLWLYILRESAVRHAGDRLGEVGGRIVGEVLVGVISRDPGSYLALSPEWEPTLPRHERECKLRDLLVPKQWRCLRAPSPSRR
jgi:hypothetical protein